MDGRWEVGVGDAIGGLMDRFNNQVMDIMNSTCYTILWDDTTGEGDFRTSQSEGQEKDRECPDPQPSI